MAEHYIRGEKTDAEIRAEALATEELKPLLASCLGCNAIVQDLLEAVGLSPFDTEVTFDRAMTITRDGLRRNLTLAREGTQPPGAVCDWVTDWFAWHAADQQSDDVVLELAGDLMLGEEQVEAIVRDDDRLGLFHYHLDNTPAGLGDHVAFGLAVAEHRERIRGAISSRIADELSDDAFRGEVRRLFRDHLEALPTLEEDLAEAAAVLAERAGEAGIVDAFLRCLARTADPVACASDPSYAGGG